MTTNDTTRVHDEAMPAANTEASAGEAMTSIYRLIADYWNAYGELMNAQAEEGTNAEIEACLRLNEAEIAICAFVPTRLSEARLKADFVSRLASENKGNLETRCTAALLSTLPALYAHEVAA